MAEKNFDPKKFIDREFEQELFEELLQLKDNARILAIQDNKGGMGKSQLLEQFRYRCRTVRPRTPVSLIALDQLPGDSPLDLINMVVQHLSNFGVDFPEFNRYESARISKDFTPIRASIYLQGATFREAKDVMIAGTATRVQQAATVNIGTVVVEFTPEQERKAQEVCLRAFFDDLKKHCAREQIVLMLDAYEKCPKAIKDWIEDWLLEQFFFDFEHRPERLILVIAGREILNFEMRWSAEDCKETVRSVKALGQWTQRHVEECLRVYGFDYTPEHLDTFYRLIAMGLPPSQVVQAIETLVTTHRKQA